MYLLLRRNVLKEFFKKIFFVMFISRDLIELPMNMDIRIVYLLNECKNSQFDLQFVIYSSSKVTLHRGIHIQSIFHFGNWDFL